VSSTTNGKAGRLAAANPRLSRETDTTFFFHSQPY
jgi:hypothetical protein